MPTASPASPTNCASANPRRAIARIALDRAEDFLPRVAARREPAIVTELMRSWPATACWSPQWFKQTYPDARFLASVNLPTSGVSYELDWRDHLQDVSMGDFIDGLADFTRPAYVRRQLVERFPGAERQVGFRDMVAAAGGSTDQFLWIGTAATRTGLHFDMQDGVLAQFHGRKALTLVSPADSACLYPYPDSITKSQVSVDAPDPVRFPRFGQATLWEGEIAPGELVFLPRHWWHAITALDVSISSSFSWGEKLGWGDLAQAVNAAGWRGWGRVSRDFVVHGALKRRRNRARMFDDAPFGKQVYELVANGIRRRLRPGSD